MWNKKLTEEKRKGGRGSKRREQWSRIKEREITYKNGEKMEHREEGILRELLKQLFH